MEKLTILMAKPENTLNKQDEIMTKCKHKQKFTLETVTENFIDQEPPDPNWETGGMRPDIFDLKFAGEKPHLETLNLYST